MPDRQRHGRLSDVFARLFPARSQQAPAASGRHRGAAPARPPGARPAAGQRDFAGSGAGSGRSRPGSGPGGLGDGFGRTAHFYEDDRYEDDRAPAAEPGGSSWPDDPWSEPARLDRSPWEPSDPRGREQSRPDPTADTMQLRLPGLAGLADPAEPADLVSDPYAGLDEDSDDEPAPSWSLRSVLLRQRRRLAVSMAGIAALGALLALPPVRAQLRDSFTRLPHPYTTLYFTSPPEVNGTVLTVPVSVHAVDTGKSAYSVRVWTVDAKGAVEDSKTAGLVWDGQALSAVVSLPVNPAAENVWVSLDGSGETLHYKIAVA